MTIGEEKKDGDLTLKEASERFGYAPDYIGQLIRKGKIEGKQVYANVAWVTTEQAIEDYIAREGRPAKSNSSPQGISLDRFMTFLFSDRMTRLLTWMLRVALVILVLAGFLVFYFISISIDHMLIARSEHRLAMRKELIVLPPPNPDPTQYHLMTYEK